MLLLATLLLFVFSWDKIKETLETTGFTKAVGEASGSRPASGTSGPERHEPLSGDGSLAPAASRPADSGKKPAASPAQPGAAEAKPETRPAATTDTKPKPATGAEAGPAGVAETRPETRPAATPDTKPAVKPRESAPSGTPAASPMDQLKSTRVASLYLIRVDDDGVISRHEVKRTLTVSDSPMSDALEALMAGPNTEELNRGFISFIPSGTRLLSAQVRGSTAYLNFNEAFMFNRYGIEGYAGQLKQIIYTATGFQNVKDVQILIEGQKREYLGGDGVYIGKPLSRASF